MDLTLLRIAVLAYIVATATAAVQLLSNRSSGRSIATAALWVGLAFQVGALVARSVAVGHFPVTSFSESLALVGVVVVCGFLGLQARWPVASLAVVIGPLALAVTLAAYTFHRGGEMVPPPLRSVLLPVHVTLAVLGNALFSMAFAVSLMYLVQEGRLKAKRLDARLRLPPLETLDRWNYRLLTWGLSLFTLAIVSGIVWAHLVWGRFWSAEPRLLWAMITWGVYAVVFQGRVAAGLRGRRAATLTIVGFATLVCSLIGVNFFTPGRHGGTFG
jgi:cytochrome c-type biogenesis protein CcsB